MASWDEVSRAAPELSRAVQGVFDAHIHKVLATVRRDGSPRVSGTEVSFRDGAVWLGSMPDARKARDLRRDPRLALHSTPSDAEMTGGDAKIAGRAVEITDPGELEAARSDDQPPGPFHLFRVDVDEVVLTRSPATHPTAS